MPPVLWFIPAVLAGLLTAAIALFLAARREPVAWPADLPPTALQRRARWSALIGGLVLIALIAMFWAVGPDRAMADARWRIPIELLAVGSLVVTAVAVGGVTLPGRGPEMDERDRSILARAPRAQVAAILVTLAAWVVYLMERYATTRLVPVEFLPVIAWSCLLVAMLALPIGVLVGYRRP
jgi:hypothetical protein